MLIIVMYSLANYNMTEKQTNDESALEAAVQEIFEETKKSLGTILAEGLYHVSKSRCCDPIKHLGQWLLTQADLRDENKI